MSKEQAAALAILLVLASLAHAQPIEPPSLYSNHTWLFKLSMPGGELPPDSIIYVNYTDENGGSRSTAVVAKKDGEAVLYTTTGVKGLHLAYDDLSTPSVDGIWSGEIIEGVPAGIFLQPVAQVAGVVQSESGRDPAGTQVELRCSAGTTHSVAASSTGAFSFGLVPSGECIISAGSDGEFAQQSLNLSHGAFSTLELTLQKPRDYSSAALVAAVVAAMIAGAWLLFGRKKAAPPKKQPAARRRLATPTSQMPTLRQKDLLATLDTKEKSIVEYVMHHHPSSVKVPKIRRDLLIPKTSLTRTLQALERKQFIKMEKIGARMFVKLHEFFKSA